MLLASSTLRFSRSSASPLAGGNHSAVSRAVSETSVSEDKSSRCPLSSLNYLAAFHALQLLQNSPQPPVPASRVPGRWRDLVVGIFRI